MIDLFVFAVDLAFVFTFSFAGVVALYGGPSNMTWFGRELRDLLGNSA